MDEYTEHLVVDVETLGLRENTVILAMAVVPFNFANPLSFDEYVNNGFMVKFSAEEQIKKYRHSITKSTLQFWKNQPKSVRDMNLIPMKTDRTVVAGCQELIDYIQTSKYSNGFVFSRRSQFDFPKLNYLYEESANLKQPWSVWKERDVVTMIDVLTGSENGQYTPPSGIPKSFIKHYCLHDCAFDAIKMTDIFQRLSG